MREEEADLSFADFGVLTTGRAGGGDAISDVAIRRYPSLDSEPHPKTKTPWRSSTADPSNDDLHRRIP